MSIIKSEGQIQHPFIHTASGRQWYVNGLTADMIDLQDIAEGLSKEARFAGQTPDVFYTVAQHSVYVERVLSYLPPVDRLAALLHDASEAYIGDQAKPIKLTLPDFNELEHKVQEVIHEKFGLVPSREVRKAIKQADSRMVLTEALCLFGEDPPLWVADYIDAGVEPYDFNLSRDIWDWRKAREEFLAEFHYLTQLILGDIKNARSAS